MRAIRRGDLSFEVAGATINVWILQEVRVRCFLSFFGLFVFFQTAKIGWVTRCGSLTNLSGTSFVLGVGCLIDQFKLIFRARQFKELRDDDKNHKLFLLATLLCLSCYQGYSSLLVLLFLFFIFNSPQTLIQSISVKVICIYSMYVQFSEQAEKYYF